MSKKKRPRMVSFKEIENIKFECVWKSKKVNKNKILSLKTIKN